MNPSKRLKNSLLLIGLALLTVFHLQAKELPTTSNLPFPEKAGISKTSISTDTLRVSLLTCSPGEEVYELYGHTAIRVQESLTGNDVVFNYGVFNFNAPHFIYRYVRGETDYMLAVAPFSFFMEDYIKRGSAVYEQELNFSQPELRKLVDALNKNCQPENCVYRYNFFFDNCATRPRLQIEAAAGSFVKYEEDLDMETFRQAIYKCTENHLWARFGIDLCLGSEADREMTPLEKLFIPGSLKDAFSRALIMPAKGEYRDLVRSTVALTPEKPIPADTTISPTTVAFLLLLLVCGVSIWGVMIDRVWWGIDVVLFGAAGCVGCILAFLALFSQHPAVGSNWNLCVFHPFHLLILPLLIWNARGRRKDYYHAANLLVLLLFIAFMSILPQKINPAILPLALSLWVRSGCYTLITFNRWK